MASPRTSSASAGARPAGHRDHNGISNESALGAAAQRPESARRSVGVRPAAPRARWLRPARRLALAGVAATAVAAGVATALIVVPGSGGQPGAGPATPARARYRSPDGGPLSARRGTRRAATVHGGQHMTDALALVKSEVVSKLPPDAAATLRAALQARMKAVLKPKAAK